LDAKISSQEEQIAALEARLSAETGRSASPLMTEAVQMSLGVLGVGIVGAMAVVRARRERAA